MTELQQSHQSFVPNKTVVDTINQTLYCSFDPRQLLLTPAVHGEFATLTTFSVFGSVAERHKTTINLFLNHILVTLNHIFSPKLT
jgi:hypothetical protein